MDSKRIWNRHLGLAFSAPALAGDGVIFNAVGTDDTEYTFFVELAALKALGPKTFFEFDALERFDTYRDEIEKMAGRLVMLDVQADPIRIKATHFTTSPWRTAAVAIAA